MSSPYPKLFREIVVPTGGWDFAGNDGAAFTATLPAATYASMLTLCAALETAINAAANTVTFTITVSSVGTVTISGTGAWTVTWASTDDDLSDALGYDETEAVNGSHALVAHEAHRFGWYPGTISFGTSGGAGDVLGDDWRREWPEVSAISGSRKLRRVAVRSPTFRRAVQFDLLHRDEVLDPYRGLDGLERGYTGPVLWYPDRDDGTVAVPGTQGDPETDPRDSSCDFWKVFLLELPDRSNRPESATFRSVLLSLHAEPAP